MYGGGATITPEGKALAGDRAGVAGAAGRGGAPGKTPCGPRAKRRRSRPSLPGERIRVLQMITRLVRVGASPWSTWPAALDPERFEVEILAGRGRALRGQRVGGGDGAEAAPGGEPVAGHRAGGGLAGLPRDPGDDPRRGLRHRAHSHQQAGVAGPAGGGPKCRWWCTPTTAWWANWTETG